MKFASTFVAFVLAASSYAAAVPVKRDVDPGLVPDFGVQRGAHPTGTGDCDGINGIKIPCSCPPERGDFLRSLNDNVRAGHAVNNPGIAVSFPTGNSKGDQLARINAALVTLQNLRGPGVGCPAASTTFVAKQQAILALPNTPAPPPPPPRPAAPAPPPPPAPAPAGGVNPALVPDFGIARGANPTGTGDCSGLNGIKIPCSCPPDRNDFIRSLSDNVRAGHAVNNPGIAVSFPTGNSKGDQLARINAALVTLQNLRGPGVGCPAASTTFVAKQQAILALPNKKRSTVARRGVNPALVPQFGVRRGVHPTGTGDCDGLNGIKIPCSCPPDRNDFIKQLNANVAAGHAVHNPSLKVSFPTGNSKADKRTRIQAAIVTLQNLRGPGVGCPAASTTFVSQLNAA